MSCAAQVGAEFLAQHYPVHTVLLPSPTWANHHKIFPLAGIRDVRTYRYYKPSTRGLDFEASNFPFNTHLLFRQLCLLRQLSILSRIKHATSSLPRVT